MLIHNLGRLPIQGDTTHPRTSYLLHRIYKGILLVNYLSTYVGTIRILICEYRPEYPHSFSAVPAISAACLFAFATTCLYKENTTKLST
jgi:hypothetical protein